MKCILIALTIASMIRMTQHPSRLITNIERIKALIQSRSCETKCYLFPLPRMVTSCFRFANPEANELSSSFESVESIQNRRKAPKTSHPPGYFSSSFNSVAIVSSCRFARTRKGGLLDTTERSVAPPSTIHCTISQSDRKAILSFRSS